MRQNVHYQELKQVLDTKDGLRIHGEDMGTLYTNTLNWKTKASTFMKVMVVDEAEEEAKAWIDAVGTY